MDQARAGYREEEAPGLPGGGGSAGEGTEGRSAGCDCTTTGSSFCLEPVMGDSVSAELKARLRAGLCSKRAVSSQGLGGGRFFDKRMGVVGCYFLNFSGQSWEVSLGRSSTLTRTSWARSEARDHSRRRFGERIHSTRSDK